MPERASRRLEGRDAATTVSTALNRRLRAPPARGRNGPLSRYFLCAEEDSNLHPLSVDQALNLVTQASDTSYASRLSKTSTDLDGMDVMDDLDVAADVATLGDGCGLYVRAGRVSRRRTRDLAAPYGVASGHRSERRHLLNHVPALAGRRRHHPPPRSDRVVGARPSTPPRGQASQSVSVSVSA
jgi:hypothetical protein